MDDKQIPYFVHEGAMVRMERVNFRLWVTVLVLILALIASNLAWFFYDRQFETYEETTTQEVTQTAESTDGDAINKFIGGDEYGESYTDNNDDNH